MDVLIFSNIALRSCVSFHDAFADIDRLQREIDDARRRNSEAIREAQFQADIHRAITEA